MSKLGRTIFIGDIHGCYKEFKLLLKKVGVMPEDKVYIVGDMINKGPKSWKLLKFLYERQEQFFCIYGNNEINFLRYLKGEEQVTLLSEKSLHTFKKLKTKIESRPEILQYLEDIPLYIENDQFIMLHGGLVPGKILSDTTVDEITRLREFEGKPWYEFYTGDKKIIYGHWALDGLRMRKNTIGLDSGCVYGKWLTAYILETGEVYSQNALETYVDVYKKNNKDDNGGSKE